MYLNPERLAVATRPDALIVFFHGQRTGGSEFRHFLSRCVGVDRVFSAQSVDNFAKWKAVTAADLEAFRVYVGIANFEEKDLGRPLVFTGVVRHPYYRLRSIYGYCKTKDGHPLQDIANASTFDEFYPRAVEARPKYVQNVGCMRMCGHPSAATAIQTIKNRYAAVGATSELNAMTSAMASALGWAGAPSAAVTSDEDRYGPIPDDATARRIMADNTEDAALYEFVRNAG